MPELPEVEAFRQLLLPLVVAPEDGRSSSSSSSSRLLQIEARGEPNVNRLKLTQAEREEISVSYACTDVRRKGKQLCLVLTTQTTNDSSSTDSINTKYLFLHMGMTGRIRVPGKEENWGGKKLNGEEIDSVKKKVTASQSMEDDVPPKYTLLIFTNPTNGYTAYFCDPRKFGSCHLADDWSALDELAPDALHCCDDNSIVQDHILPALSHQSRGIKAILLDQKKAVSGVGNWVADEVLYQSHLHPDQTHLTSAEAAHVFATLQSIVQTAVACLVEHDTHYPQDWLFAYRWTKQQAGSKDAQGRTLTFLQSGGRTSAIVASIQKLDKSRKANKKKGKDGGGGKAKAAKSKDGTASSAKAPSPATTTSSTRKRKTVKDLQEFRHVRASAASSVSAAASVRKTRKTTNNEKKILHQGVTIESSDVEVTRRRSLRHAVVTPP